MRKINSFLKFLGYIWLFSSAICFAIPIAPQEKTTDNVSQEKQEVGPVISLSFNEQDYTLAPSERMELFRQLEEMIPTTSFFINKMREVEPRCIFPENGYYTLFIPRDTAFKKAVSTNLETFSNQELCNYIRHFVVKEIVTLKDIEEPTTFINLAGGGITIQKSRGRYWIGEATISEPFILAKHGVVVHLIDGLLAYP